MRTRLLGTVAALAATALVVGGCTGDGDIEVLVDDGTDPSVLLGEAIDRTLTRSGRLTQTMVWDFGAVAGSLAAAGMDAEEGWGDGPTRVEYSFEGEFDGDDLRVEMTIDDGDEPEQGTWLVVGGAGYRTVDPRMDEDLLDALAGRGWIELPEWERTASTSAADDAIDPFAGIESPGDLAASLESLRDLIDLSELESGEIDGVPHRRLSGRIDLWGAWSSDEYGLELDPDERARWERIEAYRAEHQAYGAEVWIDGDGLVRRLVMRETDEVEPQYRQCFLLYSMGFSTQIDLFDLGAEVDITAPDPGDVMPAQEYEEVSGFSGPPWDESDDWHDEWVDDPDAPMYDTPLGPMGEHRLRSLVRMGMEWEDVDPSLADELTPEQLVELMEGYLSHPDNAALAGSGFGGDPDLDDVDFDFDDLDLDDLDYDRFAGCPA